MVRVRAPLRARLRFPNAGIAGFATISKELVAVLAISSAMLLGAMRKRVIVFYCLMVHGIFAAAWIPAARRFSGNCLRIGQFAAVDPDLPIPATKKNRHRRRKGLNSNTISVIESQCLHGIHRTH